MVVRRIAAIALAVLAVLAVATPAAIAENRIFTTVVRTSSGEGYGNFPDAISGPFLAGDGVVWAEQGPGLGRVVFVDGPGGRREIYRRPSDGSFYRLDVAEGRAAVAG